MKTNLSKHLCALSSLNLKTTGSCTFPSASFSRANMACRCCCVIAQINIIDYRNFDVLIVCSKYSLGAQKPFYVRCLSVAVASVGALNARSVAPLRVWQAALARRNVIFATRAVAMAIVDVFNACDNASPTIFRARRPH